ncbi:MAG: substrate-binding domain-containing protein [Bacteroidales bacterium]|jgi:phosphate transport system substrate-binding protein|nr:substrate-binding domain-containing protein [Bacteroidales bacterium]
MNIVIFTKKLIIIAFRNFVSHITGKVINKLNFSLSSGLQLLAVASMTFMVSCNSGPKVPAESPTRGDIKIIADESFKPLIDAEVSTFVQLYVNAKIKAAYKPEVDVINDFMNDSVKVIVTSRKLTEDQVRYLRDTLVIARTITFAYDALALITNKENKDTVLKYKDVKDVFLGIASEWKDINPKSRLGEIKVVFDNTKSGNIRYFKELFEIKTGLPYNFYALNTNAEVVDFVSRNPEAIGIISVNWISDKDDSLSMSLARKINVVGVSQQLSDEASYYRPQQGFIYTKEYPFTREVYLISRETFKGLGSGFIQWATGEQGQRIVLKSGLVPATMPIRIVQIKNK